MRPPHPSGLDTKAGHMNKNAKYLEKLDDESYKEEFQQRLDRIANIPHLNDETRQELVDDIIVRFDRRDEQADFLIEGMVTRRQIDAAYRSMSGQK